MNLLRRVARRLGNWRALGNAGELRLWVDDERPAPAGWYWATTVDEAIDVLRSCVVVSMSTDHDLGLGGEAYKVVQWLVFMKEVGELSFWPEELVVHSENPVGRDNILALARRYGPYSGNHGRRA